MKPSLADVLLDLERDVQNALVELHDLDEEIADRSRLPLYQHAMIVLEYVRGALYRLAIEHDRRLKS
jgi:hypothetical protein